MNKKGVFTPLLVLFTIFVLLYAYYAVVLYNDLNPKTVIGDKQYRLYNAYGKAEKYLFYIERVTEFAIEDTIINLTENGGFSEKDKYWSKDNYPDVYEEFNKAFNINFNDYMDVKLDEASEQKILSMQNKDNYDLEITSGYLIGKAKRKLGFSDAMKGADFTYYVNSSFKQEIDYDFTQYDKIKEEVDGLLICLGQYKEPITDKLIKEDCKFNKEYTLNENILIYNYNSIIVKIDLGKKEEVPTAEWGTEI